MRSELHEDEGDVINHIGHCLIAQRRSGEENPLVLLVDPGVLLLCLVNGFKELLATILHEFLAFRSDADVRDGIQDLVVDEAILWNFASHTPEQERNQACLIPLHLFLFAFLSFITRGL